MEGAGRPGGISRLVSPPIISSALIAVTFRFGIIDWVLGGGESSVTGGGSSETEGRLLRIGDDETSEKDEEELSGSGGCSGTLSVMVTNEEEMSSSAGRDCTQSREIVTSR